MIVTSMQGSVRLTDGGGFQVVEPVGCVMLEPETRTEATLEKFMSGFLSERLGLVRPAAVKGAGTGALG